MLGTNPISFAAPSKKDPFVLDMSTSTAAIGKVGYCKRMENCEWLCILLGRAAGQEGVVHSWWLGCGPLGQCKCKVTPMFSHVIGQI